MKKAVWLVCFSLAAACNCGGEENNSTSDTGSMPDVAETDMGDGDDAGGGDTGGGDAGGGDDMGMLPDGVSIPGLTEPATVRFDEHGVLHAECATTDDCLAVQGYYHAAHRFVQMDVQRRFATGRVAGLIGSAALGIDVSSRAIFSTSAGQPLEEAIWESSSDRAREAVTAYTAGINAWLDDLEAGRNGARLSEEYDLELIDQDSPIPRWTQTDTIAVAIALVADVSEGSDGDLSRGTNYPLLTADQAFDLLGPMSATQVATMPASGETYDGWQALTKWPDATELEPALERLGPRRDILDDARSKMNAIAEFRGRNHGMNGSNNWVLGGDVTSSGNPILANDPHLSMSNPALWYVVELNASAGDEGFHIAGVSLPGMPGIVLGHNEDIAWGGTVVFMDLTDVYVEELTADGQSVVFDGGTAPIIEVEHTFEVARGNPETRTLRFVEHHGPVISYDPANNQAITMKWAQQQDTGILDMLFGLLTASNVEEARSAIALSTSTNQNWIVADRNGDIGWFPFNAVPERPWASLATPPWLPLPGDGSAEWGPRIPVDELPEMVNPANGFIGTANTDPFGTTFDGDPTNEPYEYLFSYGEVGGFRQDAVIQAIESGGTSHTPEMQMETQGDTFLVLRDWIRPHVQEVIDNNAGALSADADEYWAQLESWDGTCPSGVDGRDPAGPKAADADVAAASIGCSAFHYLVFALTDATFADELNPTDLESDRDDLVRTLVVLLNDPSRLQGGEAYWDNTLTDGPPETRESIILGALESAATRIRGELGTDVDDWRWGRVHTVLFLANLFSTAGFTQYNEGPYAAPGGLHAINVADPRDPADGDWGFSHGPSTRHVSDVTPDGITSYWSIPGGQRHLRDSPFYDSLLDDWLAAEHFEMPFEPADVEAAAMETVEVVGR